MIEAGKSYTIGVYEDGTAEGGITQMYGCRVVDAQLPLIKIVQGAQERVINTHSAYFAWAELERQ